MRKILQKSLVLIPLLGFFLIGCQKEEILMSSSAVEGDLQATWKKIDMTSSKTSINWKFDQGKVYLMTNETVLATGNYKVDASITKVNIITSDFPEPGYDYMNGEWKVITLDDDVLVMAADYSGGTLEVEFSKKK